MYQNIDDTNLMTMVASGNHRAFAELVARHTDRYFALAFRNLQHRGDAEDVVQDAFIKLWQKPTSWKSDKSEFTTWFYRVIINACPDHRRKHRRSVEIENDLLDRVMPSVHDEEEILEMKQSERWQQQTLEYAFSQLPLSQQDALNLVVYCELPQKQAAEIMGVSLKALESLLVRAKRSMRSTVQIIKESPRFNAGETHVV